MAKKAVLKNPPQAGNFRLRFASLCEINFTFRSTAMIVWTSVSAGLLGGLAYLFSDPQALWLNLAELGGVIGLFTLVCAAEAFN